MSLLISGLLLLLRFFDPFPSLTSTIWLIWMYAITYVAHYKGNLGWEMG